MVSQPFLYICVGQYTIAMVEITIQEYDYNIFYIQYFYIDTFYNRWQVTEPKRLQKEAWEGTIKYFARIISIVSRKNCLQTFFSYNSLLNVYICSFLVPSFSESIRGFLALSFPLLFSLSWVQVLKSGTTSSKRNLTEGKFSRHLAGFADNGGSHCFVGFIFWNKWFYKLLFFVMQPVKTCNWNSFKRLVMKCGSYD